MLKIAKIKIAKLQTKNYMKSSRISKIQIVTSCLDDEYATLIETNFLFCVFFYYLSFKRVLKNVSKTKLERTLYK